MKINPPEFLKSNINVLMLIDREIQNSNKGSKRWINKIITTNVCEFDEAAENLISLQKYINKPSIRLYASINDRKINNAINIFQHKQIDLLYEQKLNFYKKINDSFCSCLMKPECRNNNLFLLDCDNIDNKECDTFLIKNKGIKLHLKYRTPNGWHYIVSPFNPKLAEDAKTFEIKKDSLMLLNWIDSNDYHDKIIKNSYKNFKLLKIN